jgi:uncharacterized protein
MVEIVWDEPKRLANIDKHGFDFAELTEDYFLHAVIGQAKRGRYKAIGLHQDHLVVVIFAIFGSEAVSVISMRPAGSTEKRSFQ